MRAKTWYSVYWIWMGLLAITFYARPSWHIPVWSALGVSSAGAMVIGVIHNRPRRVAPWLLLALGLLCFSAGDTTYNLLTSIGHEVNPFPSAADLFYMATCFAQVAGMYGLVRASTATGERSTLVDSLVLTSGVGVIYWVLLIGPNVHRQDLSGIQKIVTIAYPLSDVLVLALVARLVVTASRNQAVALLAIGTAGLLIADVVYGLQQLHSGWQVGGPVDLGWIILYAAWGAAALHPSMVALTSPRAARPIQMGKTRMALLAISALVAPVTLVIEALRGSARDVPVIAALSAVVFLLVMVRLAEVLASNRLVLDRERALRHSGDAMVSATDPATVRSAVEIATRKMVPYGTTFLVELLEGIPAPITANGSAATSWGAEIRYSNTLGPRLPSWFRAYELALVCPLSSREQMTNVSTVPTSLVLGADDNVLAEMQAPLEVLAAQATLALQRITLTNEVNRRKSEEYFRTLVQNTADVILIVDEHNVVGYASPSAVSVFGEQTVVGEPLDSLLRADDDKAKPSGLVRLLHAKNQSAAAADQNTDWLARRSDGVDIYVEVSTRDLTADTTVRGIVVTLRDVTDRRRLERELTHHAYHDPLTGVANRLLFQELVKAAVTRAKRDGATVGVLFIDLDDFKIVNDTMGHQAGDQLLVSVAKRLAEVLHTPDNVARLGGDEFAAVIEEPVDPIRIEDIGTEIITALHEPFMVGDTLVSGASSMGIATTAEASDAQDLLRQADLALYVAKGSGKGQWRRYEPELHTALLRRMQTRADLDQALKDGSFELHYQPIVDLKNMVAVGFEALVRWRHPSTGLIQPMDFIDVAEESGLIVPLGDWVMQTAIEAATEWDDAGLYVSVNVSVRQFRTAGFVDTVRSHLTESGLPPSRLLLEITESLLLPDEQQVWDDLTALRAMGVRVAIDDFGTGYSSLSYLRRVPVDVVKVDRSFVETIGSSEQQRALVEGIVWLAATLGLEVIAEGIETKTDRDLLVDLGCPLGQGYLFSPPMSQKASVEWRSAGQLTI